MHIFPIQPFGEAGIRLLLSLLFTLPLLAHVVSQLNSHSVVCVEAAGSHHPAGICADCGAPPGAELQEKEFDEALIPKTLHEVLPALVPSEPFGPGRPCPPVSFSAFTPTVRSSVRSNAPPVLRC